MMSYHMWGVCKAETSVDSHDHSVYRKVAKERGGVSTQSFVKGVTITGLCCQAFENSYDLGYVNISFLIVAVAETR